MKVTRIVVQVGLWLSLLLALIGSLYHVAWSFSTLQAGDLRMGYVQAIAVDVGLAALTIGIQQRRRAGRPTGRLWAGVALFALISTYANLLHGFAHAADDMLIGVPDWLRVARPWLLSAVLPMLVVYLSEIASEDDTARIDQPAAAAPAVAASPSPKAPRRFSLAPAAVAASPIGEAPSPASGVLMRVENGQNGHKKTDRS